MPCIGQIDCLAIDELKQSAFARNRLPGFEVSAVGTSGRKPEVSSGVLIAATS